MAASPRACKANTVGVQLLHEQPSTTEMATSPRASETSTVDAQLRYLQLALSRLPLQPILQLGSVI